MDRSDNLQVQKSSDYICKYCDKKFSSTKKGRKFCSMSCAASYHNKERAINDSCFHKYKLNCKFKFDVYDYPAEFDIGLLEEHGWYRPSNRGNNLNGVSRDHLFSIKEGFKLGVDTTIISHPANCQLVLHSYNNKKDIKCDISLKELEHKIAKWEGKYGAVPNG